MNKKWLGNMRVVAGILVFLAIFAVLFLSIQDTLKLKMGHRGTDSVKGFYEEKEDSVEVLCLGASTAWCTVDPLVLYEEYGIAAYDFGSSAQPFELTAAFLEEAFRTQHPKVVCLEMLSLCKSIDEGDPDNLNYGLTDLRFSRIKAQRVLEMLPQDKGKALSYLIPIVQYKDRWQELEKNDFIGEYESYANYAKGAYTQDKIADAPLDFTYYFENTDAEAAQIPERNREVFDRMVKLCRENGAKLLLFKSPNGGWTMEETKAVEGLAAEYGLPFVNFFDLLDTLQIDLQQDFRDNSHFNRYGSAKASSYFGQYLKDHYDLTDYRSYDTENSWDIALRGRERDRANEAVAKTESLPEYLGKLPYAGYTVIFSVTGDTTGNEEFLKGLAESFAPVTYEDMQAGVTFAVVNGECRPELVCTGNLTADSARAGSRTAKLDLGIGDVAELTPYSITYNHKMYNLVDNGITILVYDNEWNRLVDIAGFDWNNGGACVRDE